MPLTPNQLDTILQTNDSESNAIDQYAQSEAESAQNAFMQSMELQQMAQDFNAQQAQVNRDWQERMSNTSYQRAVEDLKKAGINPILAFQGMSGASTGTSSAASVSPNQGFKANSAQEFAAIMRLLGDVVKTAGNVFSGKGQSKK